MKILDQTGKVFGDLTVLGRDPNSRYLRWLCQCVCGEILSATPSNIKNQRSCRRCGFKRSSRLRHGHGKVTARSPTYVSWMGMLRRCDCPKSIGWHNYGGAGVTVCERWKVFENFLTDMGERPGTNFSIDRYPNPSGNYERGNCRWATRSEQARNRRLTKRFSYKGENLTILEAMKATGTRNEYERILQRLKRGWDFESAVDTPALR